MTLLLNYLIKEFFSDSIFNALNLQQSLKVRSDPSDFLVRSDPINCLASWCQITDLTLTLFIHICVFTVVDQNIASTEQYSSLLFSAHSSLLKRFTDTGPKTLRNHRDGSELSGQFSIGAEVSVQHFGTSAALAAVEPLF